MSGNAATQDATMSSSTQADASGPIVGVFGGSFNPPHLSHVLALAVVLARFDVERLLVVPTFQHPFAKALAPYEDRVKMCELAMGWLPRVEVSRVEEELERERDRAPRGVDEIVDAEREVRGRLAGRRVDEPERAPVA